MMELSPHNADGPSLAECYGRSVRSFGELLVALYDKRCRVVHLDQIHLPQISDEYGRLKIWGDQTKAELPARARGSLDDTLRRDDELKQLVRGILRRLAAILKQATLIAECKYDPTAGRDQDSVSSVSAETVESEPSGDGASESRSQRMPRIRLLIQQILEQIQSLYDLSALLRRPKITDKYIRSMKSKNGPGTNDSPDAIPLGVALDIADERHGIEKIAQWRGLTKAIVGIDLMREHARRPDFEDSGNGDDLAEIAWFCRRLGRANTRRREQLRYWADHPYDSRNGPVHTARPSMPGPVKPLKEVEEDAVGRQGSRSETSTVNLPEPEIAGQGQKTVVTSQSFSTAAISDVFDNKTNNRPRTVYAPTAVGKTWQNSVPEPPRAAYDKGVFICPYCGMALDSMEMRNRQSWKRHVFRDLRPYVCTFEDCLNAEKLYLGRHDWTYHELQIHRRQYVCRDCQKTFDGKTDMTRHLREHYAEASTTHLGIILDLCDDQVDVSSTKDSCIFCGEEHFLVALHEHVAEHMESISLFILPGDDAQSEAGDSNFNPGGNASARVSNASSLGFSAAGDGVDGDKAFSLSELPTNEGVGYASKFSSWKTIVGDRQPQFHFGMDLADLNNSSGLGDQTLDETDPPGSLGGRQESIKRHPTSLRSIDANSLHPSIDILWDIGISELPALARNLLEVLAFLNPKNIQKELLVGDHDEEFLEFLNSTNAVQYQGMIRQLSGRKLIEVRGPDRARMGESYRIHHLLQRKIILAMGAQLKIDGTMAKATRLIRKLFPQAPPTQRWTPQKHRLYEEYIPHVLTLLRVFTEANYMHRVVEMSAEMAGLFFDAAFYVWNSEAKNHEGLDLLDAAEVIIDSEWIGLDAMHPRRADINYISGLLLARMGCQQRDESLRRVELAFGIRKYVYDHTKQHTQDISILFHNTATEYAALLLDGYRFNDAETILDQCVLHYRDWPSEDGLPFEHSMYYYNMGVVRLYQGRVDEAIHNLQRSIDLVEAFDGKRGKYWDTKFMLACAIYQTGDFPKALDMHREILQRRYEQLGTRSKPIILSTYAVSQMHLALKDLPSAINHMERCIDLATEWGQSEAPGWTEEALGRAHLHLSRMYRWHGVRQDKAGLLETKAMETLAKYSGYVTKWVAELKDPVMMFDDLQPTGEGRYIGSVLLQVLWARRRGDKTVTVNKTLEQDEVTISTGL